MAVRVISASSRRAQRAERAESCWVKSDFRSGRLWGVEGFQVSGVFKDGSEVIWVMVIFSSFLWDSFDTI